MIGALSPYAVIVVVVLLIIAVGVLWLCRDAMCSGSEFEGEIGNRLLSMKIRTNPRKGDESAAPDSQDRAESCGGPRSGPRRDRTGPNRT